MDVLEIAKRGVYETGQFDGLTEGDFIAEINARVESIRKADETHASAYMRFSTLPEMQALFAASLAAPKGPATGGVAKAEAKPDAKATDRQRDEADEDDEDIEEMAKIVAKYLPILKPHEAAVIVKKAPAEFRRVIEASGRPIGSRNAMAKLQAQADQLRKSDPFLSREMAFAKVYADPANAKLANAERHSTYSKMYGGR